MNTQEYATAANLNYKYGNEFFYPSDISLDTFEEMKERDETIASTLDVFVASILNMIGEYQSEDDAIAEFIRNRFNLENKSIRSVLAEVLTDSLAFGFGVAEELWDVVNMQVTVKFRRVNPARPTYARFVADESDITAVRFWSTKGRKIDIPADKVFIVRKGSGIYGESSMRRIYRPWKFKKEMFKWWARGSERFSTPLLVAMVRNPEAFTDVFSGGWNEALIAIGLDEKLQALSPDSDMSDSFIKTMDFLNKLIYRGLLVPQLIMDSSDTGAYAMSKTHMEIYKSNVRDSAMAFANDLIEQVIKRMIQYQFGVKDDYGWFDIVDTPTNEDMNILADVMQKLTSAGVIDPTEQFIRDKFKFPKADSDFLAVNKDVEQ
jgi:hypothetical protein